MELKTLSRRDPEFEAHLRGTFSTTHRALPVQSLNVDTEAEKVTFRIVPLSEIPRPGLFALWAQVFRLRNFLYVLFPLYLVLVKRISDGDEWDPALAALSAAGALSLTLGALLLNDFLDHVKGVDRVHPRAGSQAIQKGWVTAEDTWRWSVFSLILGTALGIPALWVFPDLLSVLALPAAIAGASWLFPQMGLKYRRGAELVVFLLFGPALTAGFEIAVSGAFDLETLWIGVLTGLHFTFLVHLKNFESLMVNSQAGFQNTLASLGFEKGRRFLAAWWGSFLALFAAYQLTYRYDPESLLATWAPVVVPAILSVGFFTSLGRMKSPAGSQMVLTVKMGRSAAVLTVFVWVLQTLWLWWGVEFGLAS